MYSQHQSVTPFEQLFLKNILDERKKLCPVNDYTCMVSDGRSDGGHSQVIISPQSKAMDQLKTSPARVDIEFIHAIQTGGAIADKAIMNMYATHQKEIRALIATLISRYSRIKTEPADLVHDSFIVMIHKIKYENPGINSIRAYWLGIAKHMWLNTYKKTVRDNVLAEAAAEYNQYGISPEELMLEEERLNEIEKCLCKCGGRCHDILTLWLSDYSMDEIAVKLQLSSAAMARKIKHECFKKLRNLLISNNVLIH